MEEVTIPELIWPCWAYALARVGKRGLLSSVWIHDVMPKILEKYNPDYPVVGGIIVWKHKEPETVYMPVRILEDGRIISKKIAYDYHAAVYEGEGYVTDMVKDESGDIPFIIRMRELEQLSIPDYMIQFK